MARAEHDPTRDPVQATPAPTLRTRWLRWVEPQKNGLPNGRVLVIFPAILVLLATIIISLGITGSSSGILHDDLNLGADPALISGKPQAIRSDEWLVETPWTIAQVEQGLPIRNQTFPGGTDSTVQHAMPSRDWSVAFRPHLLGFLVLPLDNAMALKWWLPGLALILAGYFFLVSVLPRRPMTSAFISIGFYFAPFFQWWYLPLTLWPAVWCLAVMGSAIWLLKLKSRPLKIVLCAIVGYLTVTMGMEIYVPFIVPAVFVTVAFCVGLILTDDRPAGLSVGRESVWSGIRNRAFAVSPLLLAGLCAGLVLGIWLATRWATIEGFLATVYPGQRLFATGKAGFSDLISVFSAPAQTKLGLTMSSPLGPNSSESSTFFLPGLFLLIPLLWILIVDRIRTKMMDWMILAIAALTVLFFAYLLVPHWNALSHVLLLDRTTATRLRIGLGLLSFVAMAILIARLDRRRYLRQPPLPRWLIGATGLVALLTVVVLAIKLLHSASPLVTPSRAWIIVSVVYLACVVLAAAGRAAESGAAFLVASIITSAGVNPIYHGVYDVNDTALAHTIHQIDKARDGAWVGIGTGYLPTVVLVESGVLAFNGVQSAPPKRMWDEIDPMHRQAEKWNRLGNLSWSAGTGDPVITNPFPDQIHLTFDSCANFAQENVAHVLTVAPLSQECLTLDKSIQQGKTQFWIYSVTPGAGG